MQQIPIYTYDVHSDAEEFNHMNVVREQRLLAMALASFMGIPITLLSPNPETGHSHHILRLINSWVVENRAVDLLFKDENVYFISFRRVTDGVGGQWYKFERRCPRFS
uniref:Uncharacterized protein n=1 Tax=Arundo donax TaxID=35708 RepID=A0A0A9BKJ6_ARUDO